MTDKVSPAGRVTITLPAESSALTSSASGCTTTPWVEASARNSTNSWLLTKPRDGPSAVTTMSVSPASGSASRCSFCGSSNRTVTLERAGPTMLRLMTSGRVGSTTSPPIATVQAGPSVVALTSCGRSSLMRTTDVSARRVSVALLMVRLLSPKAASPIVASVSKTSQSVSARRNMAAGVGAANGNESVRPSPWRLSTTSTVAPRARGAFSASDAGGGAAAAGDGAGAATAGGATARGVAAGGVAAGGVAAARGVAASAFGAFSATAAGVAAGDTAGSARSRGAGCAAGAGGLAGAASGAAAAAGGVGGAAAWTGTVCCGGVRFSSESGPARAGTVCGASTPAGGVFLLAAKCATKAESSSDRTLPSDRALFASIGVTSTT